PRSGSTLVEQILAAHPDVEGASELPDLEAVILEESTFRNQRFPEWVASATPADWQRMGERYLHRTRRWRESKPRFTDKMPDNWLLAGAALAMLPGARVVNVRRDAVETCWSCFKQLFGAGRHGYSYDLSDLAETWRDYDRLSTFWARRFPDRVREQSYEKLVAEPEAETRALLDFGGLAFDPACLEPHAATRSVRTASAAQVREPLHAGTARSAAYGVRLDPLRRMLAAERTTPFRGDETSALAQRAERVQGLDADRARDLLRAAALLANGRIDDAAALVESVRATHPDHGEALRLSGAIESARGRHAEALAMLARAAAVRPDDALILNTLGTAQAAAGNEDAALASFTRAVVLDPRAANARYNLGAALAARGDFANARDAFLLALEVDPVFTPARLALADALRALGDDNGAVTSWREALAHEPHSVAALQGLCELRPAELSAAERATLENEYQRARRSDAERASLGYALANVLEARAQYREAFATFVAANALRRRGFEWDAAKHAQRCAQILESFPSEAASAPDNALGEGCIFVLGLPDTVAAAVARVLRSHPSVARGADPARVFAAESATRGQRFVQWTRSASAVDWQRIGRAYLASNPNAGERSHRLVDAETVAVEHAGAIAAMLPAARFVVIDNDALESCFDVFRRDFHARERYRCDFAELAGYHHEQQQLLQRWSERFGERIVRVDAAALAADAGAAIAQLFDALGLHASSRTIDLAAHVDARRYGDLVKPLASMLDALRASDASS
ncbi:MAG: sulfotransferase, partial [Rhodanobacteraceae bacterium]